MNVYICYSIHPEYPPEFEARENVKVVSTHEAAIEWVFSGYLCSEKRNYEMFVLDEE
jgi:hypothetical protein